MTAWLTPLMPPRPKRMCFSSGTVKNQSDALMSGIRSSTPFAIASSIRAFIFSPESITMHKFAAMKAAVWCALR